MGGAGVCVRWELLRLPVTVKKVLLLFNIVISNLFIKLNWFMSFSKTTECKFYVIQLCIIMFVI